jgi:hypothetical protein
MVQSLEAERMTMRRQHRSPAVDPRWDAIDERAFDIEDDGRCRDISGVSRASQKKRLDEPEHAENGDDSAKQAKPNAGEWAARVTATYMSAPMPRPSGTAAATRIGNKKPLQGEQVARPALPAGALLLAPLQEFAEQRLAVGLALRRGAPA